MSTEENDMGVLKEAADVLQAEDILDELQEIENRRKRPQYFLAFVGQYSAGKSCLLNHLLDSQLLPQGLQETTPLLTYLRYGAEESAVLTYEDGHTEELALDQVKRITQYGEKHHKLENVRFLEIGLPSPLLSDGMILLDTPGSNTVIERHGLVLAQSLSVASAVIYVTSGAPTQVDINKMKELQDYGMPLYFVRTHCDEIHEEEESFAQAIQEDQDTLSAQGVQPKYCWFISNDKDSKYFSRLDAMRQYLKEELGRKAPLRLREAMAQQMEACRQKLMERLLEEQQLLQEKTTAETQKLVERKTEIAKKIDDLKDKKMQSAARLEKKLQESTRRLEDKRRAILADLLPKAETKICYAVLPAESEDKKQKFMEERMNEEGQRLVRQFVRRLNQDGDALLQEVNGELITSYGSEFEIPAYESIADLKMDQDAEMADYYQQLQALQRHRDELKEACLQAQQSQDADQQRQLAEIEQEIEQLQAQEREQGAYKPKYIEKSDSTGETVGKAVGNLADWALIFVNPEKIGLNVAKVASKMGIVRKIAKAVPQTKKIVDAVTTGKSIANISKTYATVKRMSTVTNTIRNVTESGARVIQEGKKNGTAPALFDLISLEYWCGKVGSWFDEPPTREIDLDYEQSFWEEKRRIEREIQEKQMRAFRLKEARQQFESEQERRNERAKAMEIDQAEVERKLAERQKTIKAEQEKARDKEWCQSCWQHFSKQAETITEKIVKEYLADLPEHLKCYQGKCLAGMEMQLKQRKEQLNSLEKMPQSEAESRLEHVNDLMKEMKSDEDAYHAV